MGDETVRSAIDRLTATLANVLGTSKPSVYRALLAQTDMDAPVATVLENSLGGIVIWTYNTTGDYTATLAEAFPIAKTWWSYHPKEQSDADQVQFFRIDNNTFGLQTQNGDNELVNLPIQILVYP